MPHGSQNTFTSWKLKYLYDWRHTGLLWWLVVRWTSCTVRSEWITAKPNACIFCFCTRVYSCFCSCTRAGVHIPTLSIKSRGAGQLCPLDGGSPVRLHLARTHQQGHKVNKRQPLNLVLPDRYRGPEKKREFIFLTQTQEDCKCVCLRRIKLAYPHAISGRNYKNGCSSFWHMQKHAQASQQLKSRQLNGAVKLGEDKGTIRFGWRRRDH